MVKDKVEFVCSKPNCVLCKIDKRHKENERLGGQPYNPLNEIRDDIAKVAHVDIREFATGATRDSEEGKLDYEGFLSPAVLKRYAEYMNKCRVQSDGALRNSDNWQKGIPMDVYMKSMWRHFMDMWSIHRGIGDEDIEDALCAMLFNISGYLHEHLKRSNKHE